MNVLDQYEVSIAAIDSDAQNPANIAKIRLILPKNSEKLEKTAVALVKNAGN